MSINQEPVIVMCMKWGTMYGPEYVNRLKAGVERNLKRPFRFVCFTDNKDGLNEGIETFPLPRKNYSTDFKDTRWMKLDVYQKDLFGLEGTALFLDLDLVIVDSLEPFFDLPGEFLIIRDDDLYNRKVLRSIFYPKYDEFRQAVGNTSVFRYKIGAHDDIYQEFINNQEICLKEHSNEQEFLTTKLKEKQILDYWPKNWCVSFKDQCVPPGLMSYLKNPKTPKEAKIVVFAGNLKMSEVVNGKGHKWYRRIGNIDWLKEAWFGVKS
ncbi:MAG: hypothetical protein SFU25_07630 [Candidatus Caenarcaniphilales bacterium]|nr:hypothetical protein [Candidatus Caenarcaniphilales bacterium]